MVTDVQASTSALQVRMDAAALVRAQLDADAQLVEVEQADYATWTAQYAALPSDQQIGYQMSLIWSDGTVLPMAPADQILSAVADLLARDRQSIADRGAAADAEDAAIEAERVRIAAVDADLVELNAEIAPTA
jgi:hypothetical protein